MVEAELAARPLAGARQQIAAEFHEPNRLFARFLDQQIGAEEEDGDWLLFGYVIGMEEEWGYFLLSEIAGVRGPLGLAVERDLWFEPGPINEVLRRERPSVTPRERTAQ